MKALHRLAELQDQPEMAAVASAPVQSEQLVRETEAEALATALGQKADPESQLAAVQAVAATVQDDPTSAPCALQVCLLSKLQCRHC
jgi:hypothetical protein